MYPVIVCTDIAIGMPAKLLHLAPRRDAYKYFEWDKPDERGVEVKLKAMACCSEWGDDYRSAFSRDRCAEAASRLDAYSILQFLTEQWGLGHVHHTQLRASGRAEYLWGNFWEGLRLINVMVKPEDARELTEAEKQFWSGRGHG